MDSANFRLQYMVQNGCILAQLEGLRIISFMILLIYRFQNYVSHWVREAFSHKMRQDAMRKYRNVTLKPCDKADDVEYSLRKGAINKKCTFFQWSLQISGCNIWCKKGAYRHDWMAQKEYFSSFCFSAAFRIMLPTEGGEHLFKK